MHLLKNMVLIEVHTKYMHLNLFRWYCMNIQNTVNKINLMGNVVLAYNDFGIIHDTIQNTRRLIKLTGDKMREIDDVGKYHISDNFIAIEDIQSPIREHYFLYIRDSEDVIYEHDDVIDRVYLGGSANTEDAPRDKDTRICFYQTISKHIKAVNNKGNILNISYLFRDYEEIVSFEIYRHPDSKSNSDIESLEDNKHTYLVIVRFYSYTKRYGEIKHCMTLVIDDDLNILEVDQ